MSTLVNAPAKQKSVLYLDGVSVSFDGFRALNSLSLFLEPGEMRAIIGPNGAGKTTMMDVITGKTRPDQGEVVFDDHVGRTGIVACGVRSPACHGVACGGKPEDADPSRSLRMAQFVAKNRMTGQNDGPPGLFQRWDHEEDRDEVDNSSSGNQRVRNN